MIAKLLLKDMKIQYCLIQHIVEQCKGGFCY